MVDWRYRLIAYICVLYPQVIVGNLFPRGVIEVPFGQFKLVLISSAATGSNSGGMEARTPYRDSHVKAHMASLKREIL